MGGGGRGGERSEAGVPAVRRGVKTGTRWASIGSAVGDRRGRRGGFAPQPSLEAVLLDPQAPLLREGMVKFNRDYDGVLALWETLWREALAKLDQRGDDAEKAVTADPAP